MKQFTVEYTFKNSKFGFNNCVTVRAADAAAAITEAKQKCFETFGGTCNMQKFSYKIIFVKDPAPDATEYKNIMQQLSQRENVPVNLGVFGPFFYDRFVNQMPPQIMKPGAALCSEPYGYDAGTDCDTFAGVFSMSGDWFGVITTPDNFRRLTA